MIAAEMVTDAGHARFGEGPLQAAENGIEFLDCLGRQLDRRIARGIEFALKQPAEVYRLAKALSQVLRVPITALKKTLGQALCIALGGERATPQRLSRPSDFEVFRRLVIKREDTVGRSYLGDVDVEAVAKLRYRSVPEHLARRQRKAAEHGFLTATPHLLPPARP